MTDLIALKVANAKRWASAKTTRDFTAVAKRLVAPFAKGRYQDVQDRTAVPWWVIAVIHEREASQRFDTQLGQGDPLNEVSRHVPTGRGPFKTWEDGAIDALVNCAPHAALNKDWSAAGAMTLLETYNGLGYANHGVPSPYVWSGTDQYRSGKYVRDGVFDPNVIDSQLGCAGLLMEMMKLDPNITFTGSIVQQPTPRPTPVPPVAPRPTAPPPPSISHPASGSIGASIASLFSAILSIFKRK